MRERLSDAAGRRVHEHSVTGLDRIGVGRKVVGGDALHEDGGSAPIVNAIRDDSWPVMRGWERFVAFVAALPRTGS